MRSTLFLCSIFALLVSGCMEFDAPQKEATSRGAPGQGDGGSGGDDDDEGIGGDTAIGAGGARLPSEAESCAEIETHATLGASAVDVILVIDNSSSMGAEIGAVIDNVSVNFAEILQTAELDYRVILLSQHGDPSVKSPLPSPRRICVREPLSGSSCDPLPAAPVNTERFFHYDLGIRSEDSLEKLIASYDAPDPHGFAPDGWKAWLRPGSARTFLEITDDTSTLSADEFDAALRALDPSFFNGDKPAYTFHSIIGIAEKGDGLQAYLPDEPVQNSECATSSEAGSIYEELSIRTGGLRFPVCRTDGYDVVFRAIAGKVIAKALGCEFTLSDDGSVDPLHLGVAFAPDASTEPRPLPRVEGESACDGEGFYNTGLHVTLCPVSCDAARASADGSIVVRAGCRVELE